MLLEEWIFGNNRLTKISKTQRDHLRELLERVVKVPDEFQRKKFDLDDIRNWKATQYRFFLHYSSVVCLQKILKQDLFDHFKLFYVATRILCSSELAVTHAEYARSLLRTFVNLFPTYYGEYSQNIIIHNLIHLADDVKHTNVELSAISAFTFENCLGCIKRVIRGKNKPLQQLVRRIAELHSCPVARDLPEVTHPLTKRITSKTELIVKDVTSNSGECGVQRVLYKGMIIDSSDANNTIQLKNGQIIRITEMCKTSDGSVALKGFEITTVTDLFESPCESKDIGIYRLGPEAKKMKSFNIGTIKRKCVVFTVDKKKIAITLLHFA